MGWKNLLRSVQAAARQYEREARRQQRALAKTYQQQARMQEGDRAAYEVAVCENRVELLRSVHKECGAPWDWKAIHASYPPPAPVRSMAREMDARMRLGPSHPAVAEAQR